MGLKSRKAYKKRSEIYLEDNLLASEKSLAKEWLSKRYEEA